MVLLLFACRWWSWVCPLKFASVNQSTTAQCNILHHSLSGSKLSGICSLKSLLPGSILWEAESPPGQWKTVIFRNKRLTFHKKKIISKCKGAFENSLVLFFWSINANPTPASLLLHPKNDLPRSVQTVILGSPRGTGCTMTTFFSKVYSPLFSHWG